MRVVFLTLVGVAVCQSVNQASAMSKPAMDAWLHNTSTLQNIAVICLIDALLCRFRWYPGLLIFPTAFWMLCQAYFAAPPVGFLTTALVLSVVLILVTCLLVIVCCLLPIDDRKTLHWVMTILLCIITLSLQTSLPSFGEVGGGLTPQNVIMEYISKLLFGIANILLIPDILLLIVFFIRALWLLATTTMQYNVRRRDGHSPLYAKYRDLLYKQDPDEAYADYLASQLEAEAAKDVNLSRLLTKLGPVLGLIGTLISMSPALVGLSTGDISGMAYNMQVVFSATVVGLVISVVGLFTQQLKSRWYHQDVSRLEYISNQYIAHDEKEA